MERQYTVNTGAFKGLGPASVRRSCFDCHPNYGHGKWMPQYTTKYANGNGYLLAIYHPTGADADNSDGMSNDGGFITEVTGMPLTQAAEPFRRPSRRRAYTCSGSRWAPTRPRTMCGPSM